MYISERNCPQCNNLITHKSTKSQLKVDNLRDYAILHKNPCRSCIATVVNNKRWLSEDARKLQSNRWKESNPSTINGAWNKGIPRTESEINKIKSTIKQHGGRSGSNNGNYGKFKDHNINLEFKKYLNRVRVLTERNRFLIPEYNESKRGKAGTLGAYQIDHIIPIIECWHLGYSTDQCADVLNLRFISWEDNLKLRKWKNNKILKK